LWADPEDVSSLITVKDARGGTIGGLERDDFTVLAAGVPQQIAIFERQTDRRLSVVMLFDVSPSVAKERKFEQEAALRFLRALLGTGSNPADRVAVHRFSDFVDEAQAFTSSLARLEKAVTSSHRRGGTSVYDALYLAAHTLEKRQGRKVIVILTDGGDTTSTTSFHQAQEACQLADAVIYSIVLVPIISDSGRNLGGENALKTLSANTGGLAFVQDGPARLDESFRQIERDLRTQYLVAFYPRGLPSSKDRFRRIDLRVNRPGLRVLARSGYYSPPD
jgi:Ca-activated chloride channel family protein